MQQGLSRILRDGIPHLNSDLSITVKNPDGIVLHSIPAKALTAGGIGYLYERVVALDYAARGYEVEQRSSLGFRDRGIDLVCENATERIFVQCKFSLKPFSVKKVEDVLFKASGYIKQNLSTRKNYFDLVVNSDQIAFPLPKRSSTEKNVNKAKFAFLRHNAMQSNLLLRIQEVELPLPSHFAIPNTEDHANGTYPISVDNHRSFSNSGV